MITKDTIVKKSAVLYSKYGIKSVSVDDVAFTLGISKKTLYEHVENKKDLIQEVVANNLELFYTKISKDISKEEDIFKRLCHFYFNAIREIKKLNPSYIHDLKKYHGGEFKKIIDFRNNKLYLIVSEILKEGIEKGLIREDLDMKYIFFNQVHKLSIYFIDDDYNRSEHYSNEIIYKLILNDIRGITTLKGHEIFDKNYEELLKLK